MAISYGFFDSKNHDRLYKADDFNRLFNGIITDGVFGGIGNEFNVISARNGMTVLVNSGRAWFNNIWVNNDSNYPLTLEPGDNMYNRIDAIVIEINKNNDVRKGLLKIVVGDGAEHPEKPTMEHSEDGKVNQYALAYITVNSNVTTITDEEIEYVVGTDETPFISAQVDQISVDELYNAWNNEFNNYFNNWKHEKDQEFDAFMGDVVNELSESQIGDIQSQILQKDDAPIEILINVWEGSTEAYGSDQSLDFLHNDYIIDVHTKPFGLRVTNVYGTGSSINLYFKMADKNYEVIVTARKL